MFFMGLREPMPESTDKTGARGAHFEGLRHTEREQASF